MSVILLQHQFKDVYFPWLSQLWGRKFRKFGNILSKFSGRQHHPFNVPMADPSDVLEAFVPHPQVFPQVSSGSRKNSARKDGKSASAKELMNRSISGKPHGCHGDRRPSELPCSIASSLVPLSVSRCNRGSSLRICAEAACDARQTATPMTVWKAFSKVSLKRWIVSYYLGAAYRYNIVFCIYIHYSFTVDPFDLFWFHDFHLPGRGKQRPATKSPATACQTRRLRRIEINPWKVNHSSAVETSF